MNITYSRLDCARYIDWCMQESHHQLRDIRQARNLSAHFEVADVWTVGFDAWSGIGQHKNKHLESLNICLIFEIMRISSMHIGDAGRISKVSTNTSVLFVCVCEHTFSIKLAPLNLWAWILLNHFLMKIFNLDFLFLTFTLACSSFICIPYRAEQGSVFWKVVFFEQADQTCSTHVATTIMLQDKVHSDPDRGIWQESCGGPTALWSVGDKQNGYNMITKAV